MADRTVTRSCDLSRGGAVAAARRKISTNFVSIVLFLGLSTFAVAESLPADIVASYRFDEGDGQTLHDGSVYANHGTIHGAKFVRRGEGSCLLFDGVDDYVDCGEGESLDLTEQITMELWVNPGIKVQGEPGIIGKHFSSYLLTVYNNGNCYWYISGGGNNASAPLTTGVWHHVVGTFDHNHVRLYIDGQLVRSVGSKTRQINSGGRLRIGCVFGDPNATDPALAQTYFFPGKVDDVTLYNRVLSGDEIASRFEQGIESFGAPPFARMDGGKRIGDEQLAVRVSEAGEMQIESAGEAWRIASAYSRPGDVIGWEHFGALDADTSDGGANWTPRVQRLDDRRFRVTAEGSSCRVERTIRIDGNVVRVEETLTGLGDKPVGVLVNHRLSAARQFAKTFVLGGAENPSLYLMSEGATLGWLIEDDVSRHKIEPAVGLDRRTAICRLTDLAVGPGKSHHLAWSVYVMPPKSEYFDFINRVRQDWASNFRIDGPCSFFDLNDAYFNDPVALGSYLKRRKADIAMMSPWLDYDPGHSDHVWPRDEYKKTMLQAMKKIRAADPDVKIIGCIETDWVTIYPDQITDGDKLPFAKSGTSGNFALSAEHTAIVDRADLPWEDSYKVNRDGNITLELYMRGGKPQTAIWVYPAPGNAQHAFLMDQVKFLIDEVGFDGFYIDEFNQAWSRNHRDYRGWDGASGEIDSATGKLLRTYIDCGLAGKQSRIALAKYALDRGKIVVANSWATTKDEARLPVNRFSETWARFDPFDTPTGEQPPMVPEILQGLLNTPIGLGIRPIPGQEDTALNVMKAVVTYLRNGALYYHYWIRDIPESGPYSGEYGPINHMFPITPVAFHEGWIKGRERIIGACSFETTWRRPTRPTALCFDIRGRAIDAATRTSIEQAGDGAWRVRAAIADWKEFVVFE